MDEEWRGIAGFPNYEVSNFGNVRAVFRYTRTHGKLVATPGRTLKHKINRHGYAYVILYGDTKKQVAKEIHRLVGLHFVPLYCGAEVAHIDHVKLNVRFDNLVWKTHKENMLMSVEAGVFHKATNPKRAKKRELEGV